MKFRVTIKDPDVLHDAIDEAVDKEVAELHLSAEEAEAVAELRREKVKDQVGKFVEYGEYYTIEFDTDAGTATVLPQG